MAAKSITVQKAPSIGVAQVALEDASNEYVAAQAAYIKASDRMSVAEERYTTAMAALVNEVATVRDRCKVSSITLKS